MDVEADGSNMECGLIGSKTGGVAEDKSEEEQRDYGSIGSLEPGIDDVMSLLLLEQINGVGRSFVRERRQAARYNISVSQTSYCDVYACCCCCSCL